MIRRLINILLFLPAVLWGQFAESDLPIVVINTVDSLGIIDEPKTDATIKIIYNGEDKINSVSDTSYHFTSNIGIEIRGESSQTFPKKSYLFATRDEMGNGKHASFLNFPDEKDFILYAPYSDKTLMNNVLAMKIAREMGRYASRTRYVEVIINGEYQGVYVLMEKIRRDRDRVDIAKLTKDDLEGDDLTGGYIFRIDKGEYDGWYSKYDTYRGSHKTFFQYYYPDQFDIEFAQKIYIQSFVDGFEDAIASPANRNGLGKHYSEYIDLRSFIDYFILNEVSKNVDAYRLSSYFHKQKDSDGGRLVAGPAWDYNLSFGNADYCEGDKIRGWMYYQCSGAAPLWWHEMLGDNFYTNGLKCRWNELRQDVLSTENLMNWIDEQHALLEVPAQRNFEKWPVIGGRVWPNPDYFIEPNTYSEVVEVMKGIITERLDWIDRNIPGSSSNCEVYEELAKNSKKFDSDELRNSKIIVYPNPSPDFFNVVGSGYISKIILSDILGNQLDEQYFRNSEVTYEFPADLISGSYILTAFIDQLPVKKVVLIIK